MHRRTILILEDEESRVLAFRSAVASLGQDYIARFWSDVPSMIAEASVCLAGACLISLDHDLQAVGGESDSGTGLDVAEFLSLHPPVCPVIIHTSNFDGRLVMQNRLRPGRWTVATVLPREADWIRASWLTEAR
jgi:hypothetical protein